MTAKNRDDSYNEDEKVHLLLDSLPIQQADVHVSHTRKYTSVLPKKEKNEALLIYSALPATNPSITFRLKENIINGMRIGLKHSRDQE